MPEKWIPRLDIVTRDKKTVHGWIELPEVESTVVPRVGEAVAFGDTNVMAFVGEGAGLADRPIVVRLDHLLQGGDLTTYVVVEVTTLYNADQLTTRAEKYKVPWNKKTVK